jgi:hypothetical protein
MNLAAFLDHHQINLEEVVAQTDAAVHLSRGDILFVSGSLVEGLGNAKSDLDLFLITRRDNIQFTSLNDVTISAGDCLIDMRVLQYSAIEGLLKRFKNWAGRPQPPRSAFEFTDEDRKLLHRVMIGRTLYGEAEFEELKCGLKQKDLARHKLDWASHMAATLQVDLAGLHAEGDRHSMLFVAEDLLGYTMDGLLAAYGNTNPNPKWRVRLLEGLPADWEQKLPGWKTKLSPVERFMSLHRTPRHDSRSAIFNYALRIVAFARCVFPWAELELSGRQMPSPTPRETVASPDILDDDEPLPHLDLDVALRYFAGTFVLTRLNARGQTFELSPQAYLLLCLFDGVTSKNSAIGYTERLDFGGGGGEIVNQLMGLVRYARMEAGEVIDEQTLRSILYH